MTTPTPQPPPPRVRVRRYVPVLLRCTTCQAILTREGIDTHRLTDCTPHTPPSVSVDVVTPPPPGTGDTARPTPTP